MYNLIVLSGWWDGIKDDFAAAGVNTVIGLCVVFVALIFISFIISLFKYVNIWATKHEKKKGDDVAKAGIENTVSQIAASELAIDNFELAAICTAAISEYEEARGNFFKDGIVIKKITKIS